MASDTLSDDTLTTTYQTHIGVPATEDEVRGYWLFALGAILGLVGLFFSFNAQSAGVRQWAIVLASGALVLMIAGPIIRLPLERTATWMTYLGAGISALAIVWFVVAYPEQWSPRTGNLAIIALYALGVLVIAAAGAFVPVLTDRVDSGFQMAALLAELEKLRESDDEVDAATTGDPDKVAIVLNKEGHVAEAPGETIFLVRDGEIYTPGLSPSILDGITRDTVITLARERGYTVHDDAVISRGELHTADELFFSNSAGEITPIRKVDDVEIGDGSRGPITEELQSAFSDLVERSADDQPEWFTFE